MTIERFLSSLDEQLTALAERLTAENPGSREVVSADPTDVAAPQPCVRIRSLATQVRSLPGAPRDH